MKGIRVFCKSTILVIGEPLGGLEAGRFELVLKGLEKNVKYMNTKHRKKKIAQMGSLMRFLEFPSSGQEEMPRQGLQYFSTPVSVIQFPNEHRFSGFSLSLPLSALGEGGAWGQGDGGVQTGLDWGVWSCQRVVWAAQGWERR